MASTFILLLSCLVYGVAAGGSVGGRPSSPASAVSPPVNSYLPPGKGVTAGRPAGPLAGPAVPKPAVQRPTASGTPAKRVSGGRPAVQPAGPAVPAPTVQRLVASGSPGKRTGGGRPTAQSAGPAVSKSTVQRPIASGTAPKPISFPGVGAARPNQSGRKQSGSKAGAPTSSGSRTVGSHAPY